MLIFHNNRVIINLKETRDYFYGKYLLIWEMMAQILPFLI